MAARSARSARSRMLAGLAALLVSAGLAVGPALPAAAHTGAHRHVLTYVALGDSYAAGQASDCSHTASSYPRRLDALRRVKLLRDASCASATTSIVRRTQLRALTPGVRLVTVTVGANDLDVLGLAGVCAPAPSSFACATALQTRAVELPVLFRRLTATYRAIATRAPRAETLVAGYPALAASGPLSLAQATLNATIRSAVVVAAATGVHIRYVDVQFRGHTVDSPDPWFVLSGPEVFHPNAAGDAAIAASLARALR